MVAVSTGPALVEIYAIGLCPAVGANRLMLMMNPHVTPGVKYKKQKTDESLA